MRRKRRDIEDIRDSAESPNTIPYEGTELRNFCKKSQHATKGREERGEEVCLSFFCLLLRPTPPLLSSFLLENENEKKNRKCPIGMKIKILSTTTK